MTRKRRKSPFSYRPPVGERERILSLWVASGLSLNAFITRAILGQAAPRGRRSSKFDQQTAAMILWHAARIKDGYDAEWSDAAENGADVARDELDAHVTAIRTLVMEVLARER